VMVADVVIVPVLGGSVMWSGAPLGPVRAPGALWCGVAVVRQVWAFVACEVVGVVADHNSNVAARAVVLVGAVLVIVIKYGKDEVDLQEAVAGAVAGEDGTADLGAAASVVSLRRAHLLRQPSSLRPVRCPLPLWPM